MSHFPTTLNILKLSRAGLRHLLFAFCLLVALAAAPLHAQSYSDLFDFYCSDWPCFPYDFGQLTQGPDGQLYGTTVNGIGFANSLGLGTVFKVTTTPPVLMTTLWQFDGTSSGETPQGALTLGSDGYFYGTTSAGGSFNAGTLFRITTGGSLTVLHHFSTAEGGAITPPVQGKDGNFYGVTTSGMIYRLSLPSLIYKDLPVKAPSSTFGPFVLAADGNLYGTSQTGGKSNLGTVFRLTTGGAVKIIYNFSGSDGSSPEGPLMQWTNGNLYGTTDTGGANNTGEVFQLTLAGKLTVLHSFDAYSGGFTCNNDGGNPSAGLVAAPNGLFYGVTSAGGANCVGTIYKTASTGGFAKLYDFDETGKTAIYGESAYTTLMQDTNGCMYGLTSTGGAPNGMINPQGNYYDLCPQTLIHLVKVEGPIYVPIEKKVTILGDGLGEATAVSFAGVQTQFQPGSDTFLTATVPTDAVDGLVTVTLTNPAGGEEQIESQQAMHILPTITNLDPSSGPVGTQVHIVGGGFAGTKEVTFGAVKATSFTVLTPSMIEATVPTGAKTGKVAVITPNGSVLSKETFTVN